MRWPFIVDEVPTDYSSWLRFDLIDGKQGLPPGSFFLSAEEQFLKCKEVCLQDLARQQQITAIRLSHAKVRVAFSLNLVQPFNGSIRKGREKWRLASPIWLFSIGGPDLNIRLRYHSKRCLTIVKC